MNALGFELDIEEPQADERGEILGACEGWLDLFGQYCSALFGVPSEPFDAGQLLGRRVQAWEHDADEQWDRVAIVRTSNPVLVLQPADLSELVTRTNRGDGAPVELRQLALARNSYARGDFITSVIASGGAVESVLCQRNRLAQKTKRKDKPTLGYLVANYQQVCVIEERTDPLLDPAMTKNRHVDIKNELVEIRNAVVHHGHEPSRKEARVALAIAESIVRGKDASPVDGDGIQLVITMTSTPP